MTGTFVSMSHLSELPSDSLLGVAFADAILRTAFYEHRPCECVSTYCAQHMRALWSSRGRCPRQTLN